MKKTKLIGTILGVILFAALVAGLTYAIMTWSSSNIEISGTSDCFDIDYGVSSQIGSTNQNAKITMVDSYKKGLTAVVTLALKQECANVPGNASLYLNTEASGTSATILGGALKYAVVNSSNLDTVLGSGTITSTGEMEILNNINVSTTQSTSFTVYVWLDGNVADNTYINLNYSGYINAKAYSR